MFLAKYDGDGNFLWTKGMGGSRNDWSSGVAVDSAGNAYVTGELESDTVEFNPGGSGGTITTTGYGDVFLAKYDAGGNFLWAKSMGGNDDEGIGLGVAVDGSGDVYVTGQFNSATADFNPGGSGGTLTNAGGSDVFLAKYDGDGNFLWIKGMGGSGYDGSHGIAVDGSGNVYVTGGFASATADFNPGGSGGTLTTAGSYDVFLAKYDAGGNFLWAKGMGGSDEDYGFGVAVDGSGDVYGTGDFWSDTADFDPGTGAGVLTNIGVDDIFLFKLACNMDVPVITMNSFILSTTEAYIAYQWLKDNIPVSGATGSAYTVTANGNYRVVATNENGCSDTSDVYAVTGYTGIEDVHTLAGQIRVYPNPANEVVYIQSPVPVHVRITDIAGRMIKEQNNATSVSINELAKGVYLLSITDEKGVLLKVEKLVKAARGSD